MVARNKNRRRNTATSNYSHKCGLERLEHRQLMAADVFLADIDVVSSWGSQDMGDSDVSLTFDPELSYEPVHPILDEDAFGPQSWWDTPVEPDLEWYDPVDPPLDEDAFGPQGWWDTPVEPDLEWYDPVDPTLDEDAFGLPWRDTPALEPDLGPDYEPALSNDLEISTEDLTFLGPDLRLEFLPNWITPDPPVSGQSATIQFRVRNDGQQPAHDFTTHLYMDGVLVGSWDFEHIDENENLFNQYQPLPPGQATKTFEFTTPPASGTHSFQWVVDVGNDVVEQNEGNNVVDSTITWVGGSQLPDLVAEIINPADPVEIGQEATLKVKVTNQGQTDIVQPFWVFVKSNGSHIITTTLQGLKANASAILERAISSNRLQKQKIEAEVDVWNNVAESNENNNTRITDISYAAVDFEVVGWKVVPSIRHNGRPVLSLNVRNNGTVDARRPFAVHISEFNGVAAPQVDVIQLSNGQLPKAGETLTITLPIKGWNFESEKIHVAEKSERRFVVQVDPESVYRKTLSSNNQVEIAFSLYDVYKPWLKNSLLAPSIFPNAFFLAFPPDKPDHIQSKTFAYTEITKSNEGNVGGGGLIAGAVGVGGAVAAGFVSAFFDSDSDDKVRDLINELTADQIRKFSDPQLVDKIKTLFKGPTLDEDENATNKILGSLPPNRFSDVVYMLGGLSDIDDEIDGSEWHDTLKIVSRNGKELLRQGKLDLVLKLIKGLLETTCWDAEERTIIDLVKSMSLQQRWEMLKTISKDDFDGGVDGAEWDELKKLLDEARPVLKQEIKDLLRKPQVKKINFELAGMDGSEEVKLVVDGNGFEKIIKELEKPKSSLTLSHSHLATAGAGAEYDYRENKLTTPFGSFMGQPAHESNMIHELTHLMGDMAGKTVATKYAEAVAYIAEALNEYYSHETDAKNGRYFPRGPFLNPTVRTLREEAWNLALLIASGKRKLELRDVEALIRAITNVETKDGRKLYPCPNCPVYFNGVK